MNLLLGLAFTIACAATPLMAQEHGHDHGHEDDREVEHGDEHEDEHDDEHAEAAHSFDIDELLKFGVVLGTAAAGNVDVSIELPAEVRPNADRLSHLAAPFPGTVRAVHKTVGDAVAAGEVLAVIESENLVKYPLKAGFAGTVVDRHVTPGESVTRDDDLFIIADLSTVWIEIDVYLDVLPKVREGQAVRLATVAGEIEADGTVSYISPIVDPATRTATARVVLPNQDGRWRPGSFVTALLMNPVPATVVVTRRALHTVDGKSVVFVVDDDRFDTRPVTAGVLGRTLVEIRDGVVAGERYADEGSFLVKAELLKGEAEHAH